MSNEIRQQQEQVTSKVITLRDTQVILDRDVAEIYGVTTRDINKAVRNNPEKFPEGYIFTLQPSEKQYVVENFHHLKPIKYSTVEPRAFTEKGLYMLATIVKSEIATQATIAIIDTFTTIRTLARTINAVNCGLEKPNERKVQKMLTEAFTNKLPVAMRKTTFEANLGFFKFKVETTFKEKDPE